MFRMLGNAAAAVLVLYAVWGVVQLARTPRDAPTYRSIQLRTGGAFLAGASRFVPDVYEIPFFMLMVGVAMLFLGGSPLKKSGAP